MSTKDKYIIVEPYQMNTFYKEGYRFLFMYQDIYDGTTQECVTGQFMNNPIALNIPISRNTTSTRVVMELTKQSEILYGEKRENNT